MDLSVVIPVHNESENVDQLTAEIRAALDGLLDYEIVYVDDGSKDDTLAKLQAIAAGFSRLRTIRHAAACGQSTAIHTGVRMAKADWIATLDGDGQNDPADIPALWSLLRQNLGKVDNLTMIAGVRRKRMDSWAKRKASRIANRVRGGLLRDDARDTGCGLKVFSRTAFLSWPYFDHMHRFMPALNKRHGGTMLQIEVNHRPRGGGTSKYKVFDRLWVGIVDLVGMMWLLKRTRLPTILDEAS